MIGLLSSVSWRYFARHKVQIVLVLLGIALGVAVWVGIETASASLTDGMRDTIDKVAGKAQLEVSAGETGVPEQTIDALRELAPVLAASGVIESTVRAPDYDNASLLLLGIDFLGDRELRQWEFDDEDVLDDPLMFLAQPDSLCLTREFADRYGLSRGSRIALVTSFGVRQFTIRGLIEATGPARAYGGSVIVMDVYSAQYQLGRGDRFDRVDLRLQPDSAIDTAAQQIRDALGPGFAVAPPSRRSAQLAQLLDTFATTLELGSWQAMLVAVFLIYNVFAVATVRRRQDLGVLRALGARRAQLTQLFLAEGLVLGLIGSSLGVIGGRALAASLVELMRTITESAYGFSGAPPEIRLVPRVGVVAFAIGLGGALLGTLLPARDAGKVAPLEALGRTRGLIASAQESRGRLIFGALFLLLAVVTTLLGARSKLAMLLVLLLLHLAAIALGPPAARWLTQRLRPFASKLGSAAQLALDSACANPKRTSSAILALTISVSFVVSMAGFISSFTKTTRGWLESVVTGDLYLTASAQFISKPLRLPIELHDPIATTPGVRWVEEFRSFRFNYRGKTPMAVTLPFAKTYQRVQFDVIEGERRSGEQRVIQGQAVAVSTNFAKLFGVGVGDLVELPTPGGTLRLPIALTVIDYSSDQGVVWFDRSLLLEHFGDTSCDYFVVMREPGVEVEQLRERLRERLKGTAEGVFFFSGQEFKHEAQRLLDQFFSFTYVQLLMAFVVAVLGITNTLLISVLERKEEIGLLRALGATRRQVLRLVVAEAGLLAGIGCGLGVMLGWLELHLVASRLAELYAGWELPIVFPWPVSVLLVPLMLLASSAAALYPARIAARLVPAEALAAE